MPMKSPGRCARRIPPRAAGCSPTPTTIGPRSKLPKLEPNLYLSFVFQSAAHRDPENLREWRESVAGWQKLGAKMVVREGWGNHYYFDLPFLHPQQIASSLAEAHRLGFVAAYGEGSKSFATMAPNFWAISHSMWAPDRDAAAMMHEFYDSAYGPVAAQMEAFFESYEHALDAHWAERDRNVDATGIAYANVIGAWGRLLPQDGRRGSGDASARRGGERRPLGNTPGRMRFHRFGQDYTPVTMLELLESYRQLAILGVKLDTFSAVVKERRDAPAERGGALERPAPSPWESSASKCCWRTAIGPGRTKDSTRLPTTAASGQWHSAVKRELGHRSQPTGPDQGNAGRRALITAAR